MRMKSRTVRIAIPLETIETREGAGSEVAIEGYALQWDDRYDNGSVIESFERGAFPADRRRDVRLLTNHGGLPVARSSADTLSLAEDDTGLRFRATLDTRDSTSRDLQVKIERGDLDGVSVGFMWRGTEEKYTRPRKEGERGRRIITKAGELMELSLVSFPAYKSSSVGLRYEDGSRPGQEVPVDRPNPASHWRRLAGAKVRGLNLTRR